MTVTPLNDDPETLRGMSAVDLEGIIHAEISDYSTGEYRRATECGRVLDDEPHRSLDELLAGDVVLCEECWPEETPRE